MISSMPHRSGMPAADTVPSSWMVNSRFVSTALRSRMSGPAPPPSIVPDNRASVPTTNVSRPVGDPIRSSISLNTRPLTVPLLSPVRFQVLPPSGPVRVSLPVPPMIFSTLATLVRKLVLSVTESVPSGLIVNIRSVVTDEKSRVSVPSSASSVTVSFPQSSWKQ